MNSRQAAAFRRDVWQYWKKHGRHGLPWRKTRNPYRILVSEVMLQQTQAPRAVEKYKEFLKAFPTIHALAKASLTRVLKVWSGLGYNRRAKYLHDAMRIIVARHGGRVPNDAAALRTLPGIGPYTASAVRVFAFNELDTLIETNVRTAFIHYFWVFHESNGRGGHGTVDDAEILPIAKRVAKGQDPKKWHWALMDYGAYLKRSGVRINARSAHYMKQSKFEGSLRQLRGAILREFHLGPHTRHALTMRCHLIASGVRARRSNMGQMEKALAGLDRDGLVKKKKGKWAIA